MQVRVLRLFSLGLLVSHWVFFFADWQQICSRIILTPFIIDPFYKHSLKYPPICDFNCTLMKNIIILKIGVYFIFWVSVRVQWRLYPLSWHLGCSGTPLGCLHLFLPNIHHICHSLLFILIGCVVDHDARLSKTLSLSSAYFVRWRHEVKELFLGKCSHAYTVSFLSLVL